MGIGTACWVFLVGAIAAQLFAPECGEQMRGQLRTEATAQLETAQGQWQKSMDSMQNEIARLQNQMHTLRKKQEAEVEAVA